MCINIIIREEPFLFTNLSMITFSGVSGVVFSIERCCKDRKICCDFQTTTNNNKHLRSAERRHAFPVDESVPPFYGGMDGLLPGSGSVVVAVGVGSEAVGVGFAFACQPYDQQNLAYQGYYAGCAE